MSQVPTKLLFREPVAGAVESQSGGQGCVKERGKAGLGGGGSPCSKVLSLQGTAFCF